MADVRKFGYRPTRLPGADPNKDVCVYCDGYMIGRVMEVEPGHQQAGRWRWGIAWIVPLDARNQPLYDISGTVDTMEEALNAIKERTPANVVERLPPDYRKKEG